MKLIYSNTSKRSTSIYTFDVFIVGTKYIAVARTGHLSNGKLKNHFKKSWEVEKFQDFLKCDFLGLRLAKIFINSDFFKNALNITI